MTSTARKPRQPKEATPADCVLAHEQACDESEEYSAWARSHALDTWIPFGPQARFLAMADQVGLFWGGVRVGKSEVLSVDCAHFLRGTHPRQTHRGPTVQLHAGRSWSQMVDKVRSLWRFLDPRDFKSRLDLSEGTVKGQRFPILTAASGPGIGSQIRLGTYEMGALAIQGWTIHRAQLDEPPKQPFYTEVRSRVVTTGGRVRMGFCPTAAHMGVDGVALDYVWRLVDDGLIGLIHAPLCVESVTPARGLIRVPTMSRADIEAFAREIPARDRTMRLGLARYPHQDGAYFDAYSTALVQDLGIPAGNLGIGIDHGSKPGRQRASLVVVSGRGMKARIHVLRHYRSVGRSDDAADAAGILEMLRATGHSIEDVDYWVGDRAHGGDRNGGKKSNNRLRRAIAQAIGIDTSQRDWFRKLPRPLQRLYPPYKTEGSVWDDAEVLHRAMVRETFTLDPSCAVGDDSLSQDFLGWQGSSTDPHKDGVDSVRYVAVPMTSPDWRRPT